jgi:DNA polymerase I
MKKLLLIDTYNLLFRAYHALPKTFTDRSGQPTNAIYGVTSMLINILNAIKPQYMIAAIDGAEPVFRNEDFTGYKAHRKPMDDELAVQIPKIFEVLDSFGIKQIQIDGYEADDIIATSVERFKEQVDIIIVSNDRDLWQLATANVLIMLPSTKGESEWLSAKEVEARLGFSPTKIADYKGFRGDPSDNIPGVYGIGEKTATSLLQQFGSVEEIYRKVDQVKPDSLREKLLNNYEQALMSKKLAQLIYDVPATFDLEDCRYTDFNRMQVKSLLETYNFRSLIRRLGFEDAPTTRKNSEAVPNADQPSLF